MEYINLLSKTYTAELTLGATSDTDDLTGQIKRVGETLGVDREIPRVEEARKTLTSFLGPQKQTPPAYSAIKVKGQKAYQAARQGTPLQLKPRPIEIYDLQLSNYQYPKLSLTVTCSSGTYIRALARDIGAQLQTGAYLSKLCRTSIRLDPTKPNINMEQKFTLKNAVNLDELTAANLSLHLLSSSTTVAHLPSITLLESNVAQLRSGQKIEWGSASPVLPTEQPIAMFNKKNALIGIGCFDPATNSLIPRKIL